MRNLTKESREKSREYQFAGMRHSGWHQETYYGLEIFTQDKDAHFSLKIFKGSAANHYVYIYYRSAERRSEALQGYKDSHVRIAAYKSELKKDKTKSTAANCAAAIREELKKVFPGIKFSVTSENFSMGNAVRVHWTDGPTTKQVEEYTGKYQYGHFNGMEDIYEYNNKMEDIPQAKYVTESRSLSEGTKLFLLPQIEKLMEHYTTDWDNEPERVLYRVFSRVSIPAGAILKGIIRTDCSAGTYEDFFTIDFDTPQTETKEYAAVCAPVEVTPENIQVIQYSEKSIAVLGHTRQFKDKFKELRGIWQPRLACGPGWIFSKTKLDAVKAILS